MLHSLSVNNSILTTQNNDNKYINKCPPQRKSLIIHVIVKYSAVLFSEEKNGHRSFYAVQDEKQEQAERSVLISCQARTSEKKFLKYFSRHGDVKKHFFYESYVSDCPSIVFQQYDKLHCHARIQLDDEIVCIVVIF